MPPTFEQDGFDPEEETSGDEPSVLDDLDDETRESVSALLEAERRSAALEVEQRFRQTIGRMGSTVNDLRALGLARDEETGKVIVPQGWAPPGASQQQQAPAAQSQSEEDEEIPDPTYDPAGFRKWARSEARKQAEELIKPYAEKLGQVEGFATQPVLSSVVQTAAEALEQYGMGQMADHPDFAEAVLEAAKRGLKPEQWKDPKAIASVALMVVPHLDQSELPQDTTRETRRETPPPPLDRRAATTQIHRAGLAQVGAAPGRVTQRETASAASAAEAETLKILEAAGTPMTLEEYRAAAAPPDATGRSAYHDYQARQRRSTRR